MKIVFKFILVSIFLTGLLHSQNPPWIIFSNDDTGINGGIKYIAEDLDSIIWVGTVNSGLFRFDGNEWMQYDTTNSPLMVNWIWTIEVDAQNNKWIGTVGLEGGLAKFDGSEWRVWELDNYGIDGTTIYDIEIDNEGYLWMATYWDGLVKFDGDTTFTIYNSTNSNLPQEHEEINVLSIDDSGYVWYGSDNFGGGNFDRDTTWISYSPGNSGIDDAIYSLDFDNENNIWFGGVRFISKFDGISDWTTYDYPDGLWYVQMEFDINNIVWFTSSREGFLKLDYSNGEQWEHIYPPNYPELMNEGCWGLTRGSRGNFWIGYNNGYIAVYNPNAVSGIDDKNNAVPENFNLLQNYPNPFNPSTKIKFTIPTVERIGNSLYNVQLKVYDVLGKEIATLVNEEKPPGTYEVEFNAAGLPSGIYIYRLTAGSLSTNPPAGRHSSGQSFTSAKKLILLK